MNPSEILGFLLPQLNDPLQMVFLAIILLMIGVTIISAHRSAHPASWEKKWNRGTPDDSSDDLDIEHGSVTDLWHAVATAPEKLAEIMPSMLLVIGLLGTFLGLGLALNHASNILGQADALSASGAANSMQDLLGLLQGLGTKFKTSTWGITGFVLLKIWSELTRFEEKRLAWVIGKVKIELESRKQELSLAEVVKQKALFDQIDGASSKMVAGFAEQTVQLMESNKSLHQHAQEYSDGKIKDIRDDLGQIHAVTQITSAAMVAGFAEQIAQLMESNRFLHQHAQEYSDGKIKGIRDDLGQIHAVTQITGAAMVAGFAEQIAQLMESNRSLHQHAQEYSDRKIKGIRDDLGQIHAMTQITSTAMAQFTEGTQGVVENMAEAAQRMAVASQSMADGADKVGAGANELVSAIDTFKSQFTEVLDNVRKDLGAAIHNMSTQASETLERGSTQLGNATREISMALGVLSSDVKDTMSEVKTSINKALEVQLRAANEFTVSSESLNENIAATTEMVRKLTRPIEDGLRSVSESGQHMRGIGQKLKQSIDSMEQIATNLVGLPATLEPLKTLPNKQQELISALSPLGALPAQQQAILVELQKLVTIDSVELPATLEPLKTLPNKQQELISALSPLGALPAQQQAILAELQKLRDDLNSYTKAAKPADPVLTESD